MFSRPPPTIFCTAFHNKNPIPCDERPWLRISERASSLYMREGSPIQYFTTDPLSGLHPEAKSLFQNILAVSPFDARIYPDALRSKSSKSLRMNILRNRHEKKYVD